MTIDELYAVIERESVLGYRLTDNEYGFPYIEKRDIQSDGNGRFVIRFRLPIEKAEATVWRVVEDVCREIGYVAEAYMQVEREYGIYFWDCAWILSERQENVEKCC